MKKSFKSGLIVLIVLIVIILGAVAFEVISSQKSKAKDYSTNGNPNGVSLEFKSTKNQLKSVSKSKKYIGALYIEGTMENQNSTYDQKWILNTIAQLKNDANNVALAIYVNSPGGGVYQADEVYLALQDYKTSGKKIYVYMGPIAASGGYYISCAANKIYANRNTLTGSIGVISGQIFDMTELLENIGIEATIVHSGKNKAMGSSVVPFTEEQEEILQSISDECYEQFLSIVVGQRHISYDKGRQIADGRIYTAFQALNLGLIDNIDSWDNMIDDLKNNELDGADCKVKTFKKERKTSFIETMMGAATKISNSQVAAKLGLPVNVIEELNTCHTYPAYLYQAN